ncbi:MAG TPA: GlsB/YeaQ/YmgE family stress response membrane protein [bacterium]|nr:GlsB/YeaQ/YmgE family stress response membrane protein [bacterium]
MGLIGTLLIGLIAGAIAKLVMPGKDPGGIFITILLGIGGAFVANLLGQALGLYGPEDGAGLIGSILGAVLILWVYRKIKGRNKPRDLTSGPISR